MIISRIKTGEHVPLYDSELSTSNESGLSIINTYERDTSNGPADFRGNSVAYVPYLVSDAKKFIEMVASDLVEHVNIPKEIVYRIERRLGIPAR